MKYTYTISFFTISFILLVIEIATGFDVIEYLYTLHTTFLDRGLPLAVTIALGLIIDLVKAALKTKEQEKIAVFRETIAGSNHLLRNLMNNMQLIHISESVKEEFGEDVIQSIRESTSEVENIISALSKLQKISPQTINDISFSNVK